MSLLMYALKPSCTTVAFDTLALCLCRFVLSFEAAVGHKLKAIKVGLPQHRSKYRQVVQMDLPGAHGILSVVCHQPCAGKHISESAAHVYVYGVMVKMLSDLQ